MAKKKAAVKEKFPDDSQLVQTVVRLPADQRAELERIAASEDRSLSSAIVRTLAAGLSALAA